MTDVPESPPSWIKLSEELKRDTAHIDAATSLESDRGVALTMAAFFDLTLAKLLRARFASAKQPQLIEPLFGAFGPLSTFSAKIRISYAIDLLQEWMALDLNLVRQIRNEFAHSLEPKTFSDPTIDKLVNRMKGYEKAQERTERLGGERSAPTNPPNSWKFRLSSTAMGALLQAKIVVLNTDAPAEFKAHFMVADL